MSRCGRVCANVGYGATRSIQTGGTVDFDIATRRVSTSPFQALEPAVLRLQGNADATGQGGVCTGDFGSPRLLNVAGHDVAVAIVSTGGGHFCAGANPNFNYRLDTPSARAFLSQFVTER